MVETGTKNYREINLNPAEQIFGNIYHRLSDLAKPTPEALKQLAGEIVRMPFDQIEGLERNCMSMIDGMHGNGQKGSAFEVAKNASKLLGNITPSYTYDTREPWEEIDCDRVAESTMTEILFDRDESALEEKAEELRKEKDPQKRLSLARSLRNAIRNCCLRFDVRFKDRYGEDDDYPYDWGKLTQSFGFFASLKIPGGGEKWGLHGVSRAIDEVHSAIEKGKYDRKLEQIDPIDQDRFHEFRLRYGAKAANLLLLKEKVDQINSLRSDKYSSVRIDIPEFRTIPVDIYNLWRNGRKIDSALRQYFQWASALRDHLEWDEEKVWSASIKVRSSAVHSEDGENLTGAGVYKTVHILPEEGFKKFKAAVIEVFESVDSDEAKEYRRQHGIQNEEMGIIVQKYVVTDLREMSGHVNTVAAGNSRLMEVNGNSKRNLINRETLDRLIAIERSNKEEQIKSIFHFPPDIWESSERELARVAQLSMVLEKIWGFPVQIEFLTTPSAVNILQIRKLPEGFTKKTQEVVFPEEKPDFRGVGVGAGDQVLNFLDVNNDNNDKQGVVINTSNEYWTVIPNYRMLPKEGAVLLLDGYSRNGGHLQTICLERGLICVFPEARYENWDYEKIERAQTIRIVSDGVEARMYVLEVKGENEKNNSAYNPSERHRRSMMGMRTSSHDVEETNSFLQDW